MNTSANQTCLKPRQQITYRLFTSNALESHKTTETTSHCRGYDNPMRGINTSSTTHLCRFNTLSNKASPAQFRYYACCLNLDLMSALLIFVTSDSVRCLGLSSHVCPLAFFQKAT